MILFKISHMSSRITVNMFMKKIYEYYFFDYYANNNGYSTKFFFFLRKIKLVFITPLVINKNKKYKYIIIK